MHPVHVPTPTFGTIDFDEAGGGRPALSVHRVFLNGTWAHWLETTIPGTVGCDEIEGARLFFPLDRPEAPNQELRARWGPMS